MEKIIFPYIFYMNYFIDLKVKKQLIEIKTKVPSNISKIIKKLIEKGYYTDMADFAKHAIVDKIVNDFEIGLEELEPELLGESKI